MSSAFKGHIPVRLWSLWDIMHKFSADGFWEIATDWHDSVVLLAFGEADALYEPTKPIEPEAAETLRQSLEAAKVVCKKYGLTTSVILLDAKLLDLPKSTGEMNMLELAIKSELKDRLFLQITSNRAAFYDNNGVLTDNAKAAFPLAFQELRNASNCHACEMDTASVFHCMRSLENGLKAFASDLSVAYNTQNWQNLLDEFDAAIKAERAKTNSAQKQERLQFLSEASAEFRHFKDAWRNYVSHNKTTYDESQARRVLDHVASFIETLSKHLKE